jgi:hypothetical protein
MFAFIARGNRVYARKFIIRNAGEIFLLNGSVRIGEIALTHGPEMQA